ncbi:MAG TPA: DUF5657 family protein [Candidatus Dojkabacteria bacterium]|nr:DUF5657 family protein [Candidatus Dojkabacteria bacterium]
MDILNGLNTPSFELFGVASIFKLFFLIIIFGYLVYAILLALRVRILNDTVKASSNKFIITLSFIHLVLAIIGSFIAVIFVLIG